MMENKTFETQNEVLEYFEKLQLNKEPKKRESWGIFVNGERIRLSNGKAVWNQKNHASSAMKNEFAKNILPNWYRVNKNGLRYNSPEYNKLYQEHKELYARMEAMYENMKATGIIEFLPV